MDSLLGLENIPPQITSSPIHARHSTPRLLTELEPWGRSFLENLRDSLARRQLPAVLTTSPPGRFWHDVFVSQPLPWGAFAESLVYHAVVVALALGLTAVTDRRHPQVAQHRTFDPADVIYYSPSEYLPPLDTGTPEHVKPLKGEPEFAKQPILSVPPEADNRHQTIVTPPDIKLTHDVPTPNIVSWGNHTVPVPLAATRQRAALPALPNQLVAPAPEVNQPRRRMASLAEPVVAPAPEASGGRTRAVASLAYDVVAPTPDASAARGKRSLMSSLEPSVVEPPPVVDAGPIRKLGDINIGRSDVIAPAPELAVSAQRAIPTLSGGGKAVVPPPPSMDGAFGGGTGRTSRDAHGSVSSGQIGQQVVAPPPSLDEAVGGAAGASRGTHARLSSGQPGQQVVAPPPSVAGARASDRGGRLIALGIHPTMSPPPTPPQGNRRGSFAATPEGKAGAPGTPDLRGDVSAGTNGRAVGSGNTNGTGGSSAGIPPGLHVGAPKQAPAALASDRSSASPSGGLGDPPATMARAVPPPPNPALPRPKAELVDNPSPLEQQVFAGRRLYSMTLNMPNLNSAGGSWVIRFAELEGNENKGDLLAPIAEHKVDPAYPLQLMRENVHGTVTLRAIIKADGSVSNIRVVNGADQRLDHYAIEAFGRWHFVPAMKNGSNIDIEAIVMIPFKPILRRSF